MANTRPFEVNPTLTAITVAYRNPDKTLIADQVLPRVPVADEKFNYNTYPTVESYTVEASSRVGRTGRPSMVEFTAKQEVAETDDYGLDSPIPNSDIAAAERQRQHGGAYDPRARAVEGLTDRIMLEREVRVAKLVFATSTYDAGRRVTLAGTSRFNDYTNSDPLTVIVDAMRKTLMFRPNTIVMGYAVWDVLRMHPHLVNAVRGNLTNKGIITPEDFRALFDVKRVLIGESYVNIAAKGQAESLVPVWGKHIACLHIASAADTKIGVTFGFTAQHGGRVSGMHEDPNIGIDGGIVVRVGERVKELIIAKDLGSFIANAVD